MDSIVGGLAALAEEKVVRDWLRQRGEDARARAEDERSVRWWSEPRWWMYSDPKPKCAVKVFTRQGTWWACEYVRGHGGEHEYER
jgi:hypothetical protein